MSIGDRTGMETSDDSPEAVADLLNTRAEFLRVLGSGPYEKRDLVDELAVSRSTVDRGLRELESARLVHAEDGQYHLTFYGRLLTAVYTTFLDNLTDVQRAKSLLALLPAETAIDFAVLVDADITIADEPALHVPSTQVKTLIERASAMQVLAYANTASEATEVVRTQVEAGTTVDVVFRQAMYESLLKTDTEALTALLESELYTAAVIEDLPFGLLVLDIDETPHMCLLVYGENETLRGVIVNDAPAAVAWARQTFEHYRANATPVSERPPDVGR